jgi:hypothetical protein
MSTAGGASAGDARGATPAAPDGGRRPRGLRAQVADAISWRSAGLVAGGLLIQLAFILSYIGALHSPRPHGIPVAVSAASPRVSAAAVARLNALSGDPVHARTASSAGRARAMVLDRTVDAAVVVGAGRVPDRLYVASAGGPTVAQTAAQIGQQVERAERRSFTVTDLRAPAHGDGRGLSSFYLVVGWVVGGYLTATILGMPAGMRRPDRGRMVVRLAALAVFAAVSGLLGAVIVGPALGALPGHFWQLTGIGALVVFAAAATAAALQALFLLVGTGLAVLLFVVLGNPSSGGVYPASLLPPFWSAIGPALPPGAGVTVVRNTVYFQAHAITGALWVLAGYAAGGLVIALLAARRPARG